ncbi:FecR family protein [Flagellimonas sp.]|uniref:FecR family protein n=1 Tax=Flagellimonas sp. TaxID=2058762 RepID=UPI003B59A0C2
MQKIEKLIVKYLTDSISKKEWEELNLWFEQSKDTQTFREYIKINYAIEDLMSEFNTEKTKKLILEKIKKDKRSVITLRITKYLKYAAIAVLLVGLGLMYEQDYFSDLFNNKNSINTTSPNDDTIVLEHEDGNFEIISEGEVVEIVNSNGEVIGKQEGNRLIYGDSNTNSNKDSEELIYNQLTVPYGKRFELELSDGTIAHLNAGSSLKYPVKFLNEGKREVFLVGEVFLDVTKDAKRPFTISTSDNLDIQVLGTQFNVSNYPEDATTEVVLVEGSVGLQVNGKNDAVVLEPGFKGSFNRQQRDISTTPVITSVYTSWVKGELVFRAMSLENILKKLERHYNVTITNQNLEYSQKRFNANFGNEPIETVLNYFKNTYGIDYTINNDKVTLN